MQLRAQLVLFCFATLYGMEQCSSSWKIIIFRKFNGLAHFLQAFWQVKTWLILELHGMTTVSNLVACLIVFCFCFCFFVFFLFVFCFCFFGFFCLEILADMDECSNIWEMVKFKYLWSLWLIFSKFWVSLCADHTVYHKNCDSIFYNCVSNALYCALKSRSAGRSAQTYGNAQI